MIDSIEYKIYSREYSILGVGAQPVESPVTLTTFGAVTAFLLPAMPLVLRDLMMRCAVMTLLCLLHLKSCDGDAFQCW